MLNKLLIRKKFSKEKKRDRYEIVKGVWVDDEDVFYFRL